MHYIQEKKWKRDIIDYEFCGYSPIMINPIFQASLLSLDTDLKLTKLIKSATSLNTLTVSSNTTCCSEVEEIN